LGKWLDGQSPPKLAVLPEIAALTGLSHAYQLSLGGVLPRSLQTDAYAMQVAEELRNAVGSVEQLVTRAAELAFADAGARLAGILLEKATNLEVTLRRAYRGTQFPIHLSTYVGVDDYGQKRFENVEDIRREVTRIVGESAGAFGARWREQDAHDWDPPRPRLILNVPQHERPRAPAERPLSGVPNILMLGCPYAHAEFVGALLAESLGYGYHDVRYSVPLPLDRSPTDPLITETRTRYTKALLTDDRLTAKHVWSITDHRVIPNVLSELSRADIACAIYVRSEDRLLERGGEVWRIDQDEMRELRNSLDRTVHDSPWPALTVSIPDELLLDEESARIESHRVADIATLAAVDTWRTLASFGYLPRGNAALGALRRFFDDQGKPIQLRASTIKERHRMPARPHS
jgi:hypothetical protein